MNRPLCFLPLIVLSACSTIPQDAYFNRGTPESLMDVSSEKVVVRLSAQDELVNWLNQEAPSRAELSCTDGDYGCEQAKMALNQFRVPYSQTGANENAVALYYDRVAARDCENRFIDNSINPYNLHHPTFGCSVALNMVQSVTDKRQFVAPTLLDYPDGERTATIYRRYQSYTAPVREGTTVMRNTVQ